MNHFINNIHINKLFHLENFDIPISDKKYPHLIITGKNGSGKTVLLNAIANWLENTRINDGFKDISSKNLGDLYYAMGNYDAAISFYKNELAKIVRDKKKNKSIAFKSQIYNKISGCYMAKGDYSSAWEYHNTSKKNDILSNKSDSSKQNQFLSKAQKKVLDDFYKEFNPEEESINKYGVICDFYGIRNLLTKEQNKEFIIAYYSAQRANIDLKMIEPKSPTKPELNTNVGIKETYTEKFLEFLSDLRIQGALAQHEKQFKDADEINAWFDDFVKLLQQIFQDNALKLKFDYRNYSFKICSKGKMFKFTELSDGFAAIIDIVADLILKMQDENGLTRSYKKEGIVLIDEIETHLHLSLQKNIMPFLTKTFPNIQFIVTTHSPFVLSSLPNAVAYDLEHKEILDNLTEYSYESLAEGYFGVRTPSSYAEMQLDTLKKLIKKDNWTDADKIKIMQLKSDFEQIPETISPLIVGDFRQFIRQNDEKLKDLKV